jgi:hypothetical protein
MFIFLLPLQGVPASIESMEKRSHHKPCAGTGEDDGLDLLRREN